MQNSDTPNTKTKNPTRNPNRIKDLTGQKFGRLTVLEHIYVDKKPYSRWVCQCECGNRVIRPRGDLVSGHSKSCGCLATELLINRNTKHGFYGEHLYNVWNTMRQRCNDPNKAHYDRYGGRGISICNEWNDYNTFREWAMSNGYKNNLTIDRIDVNGNYCPENCRWVTWQEQQNNRTSNRMITANGETHTIAEWSRISGIKSSTIQSRLSYGWDEELAVTLPKRIDENGKWIGKKRTPERDERGRWKANS